MAAARIHHRARPWRHAAAAVLGVSWALASHAESPMLTDDAGTLDAGGFKIEARHTWDALARSEELALGFAPLPKVELGLSAASERDRTNHPADTAQVRGLSVKWVPLQSETGLSLGVLLDSISADVGGRAFAWRCGGWRGFARGRGDGALPG